jgi:competence protein ComEA
LPFAESGYVGPPQYHTTLRFECAQRQYSLHEVIWQGACDIWSFLSAGDWRNGALEYRSYADSSAWFAPMDAPTPTAPTPTSGLAVPAVPALAPTGPAPITAGKPQPAQLALGAFLAITLGLLAFRGYGNGVGARPTESVSAPVTNLNRADRAELEQVPGIGPTLAKEIEDHRKKKGLFKSVDELRQVKGMGPVTFDKVRPFLQVEAVIVPPAESPVLEPLLLERKPTTPTNASLPRASGGAKKLQTGDPPIDVNVAGLDELTRLPGIGPVTAQNIITARNQNPFRTLADLDHVKGIGPKTLEKIRPFVVLK